MWKKENDVGTQPMPTMATYSEAMDKFTKSATAFMEHVHHLTQARDAYQEAMTVSTAIRNSLDAGDQALRSLLLQLEQAVNFNLGKPPLDKKRPEPVRAEAARADGESTGAVKMFP
jgi:exonuclease VII small subunit